MIRVMLVDDQELVRTGLRVILDSEPDFEVVGEAADGAEAVALAETLRPDVICMDVEMPIMNGIDASQRILEATSPAGGAPAVLILTTFGHERYLFDALAAGVSGFLLKTSRAEQLIEAVRTLAGGQALLGTEVTRAVIERIAAERGIHSPGPARTQPPDPTASGSGAALQAAGLTEREQDVIRLLAEGRSNAEIAQTLFLGEATVKTHVSNILQKLGVRDRIQAVVWAHTNGVLDG